MRLSKRLARLRETTAPPAGKASGDMPPPAPKPQTAAGADAVDPDRLARVEQLRAMMGGVMERQRRRAVRPERRGPQPLPVGELVDRGHGAMYMLERYLAPQHQHGRVSVASALSVPSELVGSLALDPSLADVDLSGMLILDTETTGLAGGAGTVPFLIGLCYFVDGALKVEQLFLTNLGAETPLLRHLSERIAAATCVVSYNGKTFDWPLLRSRYILNRVPAPKLPPHLDLLHCARRVFRGRLERVKLTAVEREVLGFYRDDDVPGAEIPGLYMSYLRGGDPRGVLPILEHNELDLVALAALLGEMGRHFNDVQRAGDPRDHLAYARVAQRARDDARALRFAEAAAEGAADDGRLRLDALRLAAHVARTQGDSGRAVAQLQQALACDADQEALSAVHLALSKLYEHDLRDTPAAYRHALNTAVAEGEQAHGRRRGRLYRRLLRALPQSAG